MAARSGDVPILQRAAIARRVEALFRAMSTDFLLREQFVTAPAEILSEYVHGKAPSPERAAVVNQLVYATMAHPRLLAWVRDYAAQKRSAPPSLDRAVGDFTRAVVGLGARHVVLALVRSSIAREPIDFAEVWAVLFGGGAVSAGGVTDGSRTTTLGGTKTGETVDPAGLRGTGTGETVDYGGTGTGETVDPAALGGTKTGETVDYGGTRTGETVDPAALGGTRTGETVDPAALGGTHTGETVDYGGTGTGETVDSAALGGTKTGETVDPAGLRGTGTGETVDYGGTRTGETVDPAGLRGTGTGETVDYGGTRTGETVDPAALGGTKTGETVDARGTGTGETVDAPGTGTKPTSVGIFGSAYANVALEALAQYAAQLLAMGALDTVYET